MASEFYGYFDTIDGDEREYDAARFSHLLKAVARSGVSSHAGGLEVTADGLGMQTSIAYGGAVIEGYVYVLEDDGGEPKTVTHEASGAADRLDRIVVRLEKAQSERRMRIVLLTGVPSADPEPPELTRTSLIYEISLARVRVRAAATVIESDDVVDERGDETVCGYAIPQAVSENLGATMRQLNALRTDFTNEVTTLNEEVAKKFDAANVANNLTTTEEGYVLDARQGKILNDAVAEKCAKAAATASLATASWSGSGPYTQTASVSIVTASNAAIVTPAPASYETWAQCGVYASTQAAGSLTFTAKFKPTSALTVNVLCIN